MENYIFSASIVTGLGKSCVSALKQLVWGVAKSGTGKSRGVSPHRLRDAFAVHCMKTDDSGEGMRLLQEHLVTHLLTPQRNTEKLLVRNIRPGTKSSG